MMVLVVGCKKDKSLNDWGAQVPDPNGMLNLSLSAEPSLLNPILSTDAYSSEVIGKVFNGLIRINEDLKPEPDLATSYNVSEDGTIYTFYLRKDVKWHDGRNFTAEDVSFTFKTIMNPDTNTVRRSNYYINKKPISIIIVNDYVLKIISPEPFAPLLMSLGIEILPEHILNKDDINKSKFNFNPIGTGPYKFVEWKSGQYIKLVRNENYFGPKPKVKEILYKIIPDTNTNLVSLSKQEIDMAGIPAKDLKRFEKDENLEIFQYQKLHYSYIGINQVHPILYDIRVRKAISHAINKDSLVRSVLKGKGKAAWLPTSPELWSYPDNQNNIPKYDYSPEKSRKLLVAAGYEFDHQKKLYKKNGKELALTIFVPKGNKVGEKCVQIIQQFLAQVGIKLDIQVKEWRSLLKIINASDNPKKFDMVMLGWSLGIDPDSYSIWHSSQYPNGFNFIGYRNLAVNKLLIAGRQEVNIPKRKAIYEEIYQKIAFDVPYIFLFYPDTIIGVNKRVGGLSRPGPAGLMNRIEDVFVTKPL
jgi:peptide/nickel transport system substrate-binding protein